MVQLITDEKYLILEEEVKGWRSVIMLFCSMEFLFVFLPIVLLVYYIAPQKMRNVLLFVASLVFYIYGERQYVYVLLVSMTVNYFAALGIQKVQKRIGKRLLLAAVLMMNFGTLFVYKYLGFAVENLNRLLEKGSPEAVLPAVELVLPLGISFYTFQLASYVIDVYCERVKAEENFLRFGTYLCMFPQLIAGPIVRYSEMRGQLRNRSCKLSQMEEGCKLFTLGLASKMLLANPMGAFWNHIQVIGFESISTPMAWLGAISFTFQIYFDFNGYSLMAMGLCRMLGFYIEPNFRQPYQSKSLTEFWRRWHISLGTWFREYIYIPLGGNRRGKVMWVRNLLIVWLLTGIWHGADWNFFLWGIFLFVILLLEKVLLLPFLEKSHIISRVYMAVLIPVSWMIFAITDIRELGIYLSRMFGISRIALSGNILTTELISSFRACGLQWILCLLCILPFPAAWYEKHKKGKICTIILLCIFWLSVYQIIYTKSNPFLYFRF